MQLIYNRLRTAIHQKAPGFEGTKGIDFSSAPPYLISSLSARNNPGVLSLAALGE